MINNELILINRTETYTAEHTLQDWQKILGEGFDGKSQSINDSDFVQSALKTHFNSSEYPVTKVNVWKTSDYEVEIIPHHEDLSVTEARLNLLPKETIQEIQQDLERGNEFAWCMVEVRVTRPDHSTASDFIGGCSYKDAEDFKQNSGYFKEMVSNCLEQLTL